MTRFFLGIVFVIGASLTTWASVLSDAASALGPGQATTIETGLTGVDLRPDPDYDAMIVFTDSAVWDPVRRQVRWIGAQAGDRPWRNLVYDEQSNRWSYGPLPPGAQGIGHGYDHNTVDPATGDHYFRPYNANYISRWDGNSWSNTPSFGSSQANATSISWFPELGGLVYSDIYRQTYFDGLNWNQLSGQLNPRIGEYHNVSQYNPVHKVLLFGGGVNNERVLYKMDSSGQITRMNDAPVEIGYCGQSCSYTSVDPVSGDYIVFEVSSNTWWAYDILSDSWRRITSGTPQFDSEDGKQRVIQTPISTHGIIMYIEDRGAGTTPARVWIYKHSASGGSSDEIQPTAPSDLATASVSSERIDLFWGPSWDNVGVAGYRIYRNGSYLASTVATVFQDTTVSPSTDYSYYAIAYDAAENTSDPSNSASASTPAPEGNPPDPPSGLSVQN